MASEVEQALWEFEEAVAGVLAFVKSSAYGLRLATKRIGDLTMGPGDRPQNPGELEELRVALENAPDRLSDVTVLALGGHLRAFLAHALALPELPPLPDSADGVESLAGTPGAAARAGFWFALLLQLHRLVLQGGRLDRRAMQVLGVDDLELRYPSGKVKLHAAGDTVTLTEGQLHEVAQAVLEAARSVHRHLRTA